MSVSIPAVDKNPQVIHGQINDPAYKALRTDEVLFAAMMHFKEN
jgi:hypothetical protein